MSSISLRRGSFRCFHGCLTMARKIRSPLRHKEMKQKMKKKKQKNQKMKMKMKMKMKEEMWRWWIPAEMHTSDPDIDETLQTLVASAKDLMEGERDD